MNQPNLRGISVLVDGGCLNNNRPLSERKMYGSMTVFHNGKQVESTLACGGTAIKHEFIFDEGGHRSNNLAELEPLYSGLLPLTRCASEWGIRVASSIPSR